MEVVITSARDRPQIAPDGRPALYSIYQYTIDGLGPFTYEILAADDTTELLKAAIQARIDRIKEAQNP